MTIVIVMLVGIGAMLIALSLGWMAAVGIGLVAAGCVAFICDFINYVFNNYFLIVKKERGE